MRRTCGNGLVQKQILRLMNYGNFVYFKFNDAGIGCAAAMCGCVGAILYAMLFSIFARSFSLIAAEHPVKVAGITKAAAIRNLRDRGFGGA